MGIKDRIMIEIFKAQYRNKSKNKTNKLEFYKEELDKINKEIKEAKE